MTKKVTVTGSSGFLAKHIVLQLLEKGYFVSGSVRSSHREEEVRQIVRDNASDPEGALGRLEFLRLDLNQDQGWDGALKDVDALFHTASPFPLVPPKNEDDLIRPAVDGTLRALNAAKEAGVNRVVLTSSIAAIISQENPDSSYIYDDSDWTDIKAASATAYNRSKTLAERAAWDFVENGAKSIKLTTINPGLILGPALDTNYGGSMEFVERILRGKDPAVPQIGFSLVDVRDVASAHVRALEVEESAGKRIICVAEGWVTANEMAQVLTNEFPQYKPPRMIAPNWLIKIMAIFDGSIRSIVPILGVKMEVTGQRSKEILGIDYLDWKESLVESGKVVDAKISAGR